MTTPTASSIFLVDSSGWIEYFGDGAKADAFGVYLEKEAALVVPTLVLFEVCRKLTRERGKPAADRFSSQAMRCIIVPLDDTLALEAARVSLYHRLTMANAVVYATALAHQAKLVTADTRFLGLPGVIIP